MSESRREAVSAAVSLLYTGSCSLSKVSFCFFNCTHSLLKLLQGRFTFFEVIAEVREVFECLGIQLEEDCFTVVDKNTTNVKKEQCVDDDMLWEEPLEEKSVSIDDEFTSFVPLTIDLGEYASVCNMEEIVEDEDQQSLLVSFIFVFLQLVIWMNWSEVFPLFK